LKGADEETFHKDLAEKQWVILRFDSIDGSIHLLQWPLGTKTDVHAAVPLPGLPSLAD
jgi:hypothetical protein